MFAAAVPVTGDDHEAWGHSSFSETEQETNRTNTGEVMGCCEAHFAEAP